MQNKLLPCPFCGGEVEMYSTQVDAIREHYGFHCKSCDMATSYDYPNDREEAIKHWNTRKPLERIVEQLENYKNCYEKVIGQVIVDNYDINLERVDLMNCAIDIVRKGGVDNAE